MLKWQRNAWLRYNLFILFWFRHRGRSTDSYRLRSDLVPEHGARERFLMGTNVNTPFFQVPTPEFGHSAHAWVQGLDLVFGH